jgi:hypothetical protein
VESSLLWEAEREPGGNVKRGAGTERRNGFQRRETSEGKNPTSVSGMKQGRKGQGRNQGAERLRKPESTAQPGKVSPVQVADLVQNAEGAKNLKRVSLFQVSLWLR